MLIILIIITLSIILIVWSRQTLKKAMLLESFRFIDDLSPRLRISVIAVEPQSVNYIASLLKSESLSYQVVVVADFNSSGQLLGDIVKYFHLHRVDYIPTGELMPGAIRALFRSHSRLFAKIVVVDSPKSKAYTPFEVGAVMSSYNFNLQLHTRKVLNSDAVERLLLELAIRAEGSVEEITSAFGERVRLVCREAALPITAGRITVNSDRKIKINYRLLK